MARGPHRQGHRAALGVCVLLAHGLMIWSLAALLTPRPSTPAGAAPPLITWLALRPVLSPAPAPVPAPATPAARRQAATVPKAARAPNERSFEALRLAPQPTVAMAVVPPNSALADPARGHTPAPEPSAALAAATAASRPPAGTLNLALPPGRSSLPPPAAWAGQDDRLQARPNRDERLAQALGTDTRRQEFQRGETRRFQQGRTCVDAAPAREAQLNPFNQSVSATPRQIRPC